MLFFSNIYLLTIAKNYIGSITFAKIIEEHKEKCQCFIYNRLSSDYKSTEKYLGKMKTHHERTFGVYQY